MPENTGETIFLIAQVLTLCVLVVYVIKTWHIASATKESARATQSMVEEMRESRDWETAPYIVAFFDKPYGRLPIDLVIKNVGKTMATDVKVSFEPKMTNSLGNELDELTIIKDGIPSMPPGYEIRTFFDMAHKRFENVNLPLTYKVSVTFSGGSKSSIRKSEYIIDLSQYKSLLEITRKDVHDIAESLAELVRVYKK
jgi:hypothetical protein